MVFNFRYVEVNSEQVCCVDETEDRVNVGIGDSCCGSNPYSSNGSQICCDGAYKAKNGSVIAFVFLLSAMHIISDFELINFKMVFCFLLKACCKMATSLSAVARRL